MRVRGCAGSDAAAQTSCAIGAGPGTAGRVSAPDPTSEWYLRWEVGIRSDAKRRQGVLSMLHGKAVRLRMMRVWVSCCTPLPHGSTARSRKEGASSCRFCQRRMPGARRGATTDPNLAKASAWWARRPCAATLQRHRGLSRSMSSSPVPDARLGHDSERDARVDHLCYKVIPLSPREPLDQLSAVRLLLLAARTVVVPAADQLRACIPGCIRERACQGKA